LDDQWVLVEPMITAWKQDRVGRSATGDPGVCDLREVVNAIFYQNRTGCQWRYLPHDLPAWSAVFYYFTLWRQDGLDQRIQELLRCQVREKARRAEDPSLVITDTQSVRAAAGVPKTTTGLDANKRTPGRKRGLAVDVLGLIIGVVVLAASAHDNAAGTVLFDLAAERCGNRLEKALADQGFKDEVIIHGALPDVTVEVVRRKPGRPGQGLRPAAEAVGGRAGQRHPDAAPAPGPRVRPPARELRLTRLLGLHREHVPSPHHNTRPGLARHPPGGRVTEFLTVLQARHDEAVVHADELRGQTEDLTSALAETEALLPELATARKAIAELAPTDDGGELDPPEPTTAYQAIMNAFNQHPDQAFRVRELHELLGMPTDDPAMNVTRSRRGRLTRQGFLTQPGRAATRNGLDVL
jgi:transposase